MLKHSNYLHPFQNYSIIVLIKGCLRDHRLMDCTVIDIVLNVFSYRFRSTYKTAFTFASGWFLYHFFRFRVTKRPLGRPMFCSLSIREIARCGYYVYIGYGSVVVKRKECVLDENAVIVFQEKIVTRKFKYTALLIILCFIHFN